MLQTIINYFLTVIVMSIFNFASAQEICDNGMDDDADGLIDLNDTVDCMCTLPPNSIIRNPSFEEMTACPTNFTNTDHPREFEKAKDWFQANQSTTSDYYNCTYLNKSAQSLGLKPQEGTGMAGIIVEDDWREYIGQCLNTPFVAGKTYTLHMQIAASLMPDVDATGNVNIPFDAIDLDIYGNEYCDLPFNGSSTTALPLFPEWKVLGKIHYTPSSSWRTVSVTFTPLIDIRSIVIGADSLINDSYVQYWTDVNPDNPFEPIGEVFHPYFYFDNLILGESTSDPFIDITFQGSYCTNSLVLTAHSSLAGGTWQWYKDGVAMPGKMDSVLNVSENNNTNFGLYTSRYLLNGKCYTRNYKYELSKFEARHVRAYAYYDGAMCYGTNQAIKLIGSGAFTYSWNNGIADGDSVHINDYITSNSTFPAHLNFIVTGTDAMGCKGVDTFKVVVLKKAQEFLNDTLYKCFTDSPFILPGSGLFNPQVNGFIQAEPTNVTDSSGKFFYPDSAFTDGRINYVFRYLRPDTATCWSKETTYIIVGKPDTSTSNILRNDTSISFGNTITLNTAQNAINWSWSTTETTSSITVAPKDTSTYCVTVTLKTGCSVSDCVFLNVIKTCEELFIPTAFSPNNDGINDVLYLKSNCLQEFDFKIFDRWGNKVFESSNISEGWDGKYNDKPMDPAVFAYYINGIAYNGNTITRKGNVSLVK